MSSKKIGFWSVWALGVGGIVGGLFPALGVVIQIADVGAPLAFAIAGIIALITTYAYGKLSVAHPCRGGTVTFLNQAFGSGLFSGTLNLLLWFSYVVMLSFYSSLLLCNRVRYFALRFNSTGYIGSRTNRTDFGSKRLCFG